MGTSSFYAALSGLSANRQAIDVIGNNLANLNTIGFKKSFTSFADVLGSSLASAVNGAGNPLEIGLGATVASIDQVFSQGSLKSSGMATDMAIQGAGFFMVEGDDGINYTRAGKFSFDADGNLVSPNGKTVLGYSADATGTILSSTNPAAINVSSQATSSPNATSEIFMNILLDANADPDALAGEFSTPIRVFDSLGVSHTINFVFRRSEPVGAGADPNTAVDWNFDIRIVASDVDDGTGVAIGNDGQEFSTLAGAIIDPAADSIADGTFPGRAEFNADGKLISITVGGATYTDADLNTDPNGIDIPGAAFAFLSGANNLALTWDVWDADGTTNLVSYESTTGSATNNIHQDGFGVGVLNSVIVAPDGTITGLFSNGDVRNLAQIALANFNNPQGLLSVGDNEYKMTPGSGQASIGGAGTGGRGAISGNSLELSNVDLAEEFTNLILAERGFQANSRVITTNDQLLQEAINLSR